MCHIHTHTHTWNVFVKLVTLFSLCTALITAFDYQCDSTAFKFNSTPNECSVECCYGLKLKNNIIDDIQLYRYILVFCKLEYCWIWKSMSIKCQRFNRPLLTLIYQAFGNQLYNTHRGLDICLRFSICLVNWGRDNFLVETSLDAKIRQTDHLTHTHSHILEQHHIDNRTYAWGRKKASIFFR